MLYQDGVTSFYVVRSLFVFWRNAAFDLAIFNTQNIFIRKVDVSWCWRRRKLMYVKHLALVHHDHRYLATSSATCIISYHITLRTVSAFGTDTIHQFFFITKLINRFLIYSVSLSKEFLFFSQAIIVIFYVV